MQLQPPTTDTPIEATHLNVLPDANMALHVEGTAMLPSKRAITPEQEARQLIKRLRRLDSQWPSEPTLSSLEPQTIDALLKIADKKKHDLVWVILGAVGAYFLFYGILIAGLVLKMELLMALGGVLMLADFLVPPVFYLILRNVRSHQRHYATYALTQTNDVRVLNMLIQPANITWGRHPDVLRAILRLLEQVGEWHLGLLTPSSQNDLWNLAITPPPPFAPLGADFALQALRVLACVGNSTTLWRMKQLANQREGDVAHASLVVAARQYVPYMEARLQRLEVPQTLLRASALSTAQPDTLLRAAHTTTPEPAAQLLRASTSDEEDMPR